MYTTALKNRVPRTRWIISAVILFPVFFWYLATPWVSFHYSSSAKEPLKFTLISPDELYGDHIPPGEARGGPGHIFPDEHFYMQFEWRSFKSRRCIAINPKWPNTHIYIDAEGEIDRSPGSGTDIDRVSPCPNH